MRTGSWTIPRDRESTPSVRSGTRSSAAFVTSLPTYSARGSPMSERAEVVVIGGGQAGLAAGYYLRRAELDFVILDRQDHPGGAWQHGWDSLRLFSPAEYSPLPGWRMPHQEGETFPTAGHVVKYLHDYEQRYELPVRRPIQVSGVRANDRGLNIETDHGNWHTAFVISAKIGRASCREREETK